MQSSSRHWNWLDPDIAEFMALRDEIANRTRLQDRLIEFDLIGLGGGLLTLLHDSGDVHLLLIAIALATAILWLLWVDHAGQILNISEYIATHLSQRVGGDALKWEYHIRDRERLKRLNTDKIIPLYVVTVFFYIFR